MTPSEETISARFGGALGSFSLDVAFDVPARGITAIYGPSGCGKTTVLRCIAGLRRMAGRLRVGGQRWQDDSARLFLRPYERPVGYVFQEASLFAHLSVRGNLAYGARRGPPGASGPVLEFGEVVELLGIGRLLERSPEALSGGERQRVAIGRALLRQPRLLLMDEPLAGLDQEAKEGILPYLETLHERLSIPILYVSHDIREVARLADTVVVLAEGRRVCEGPLGAILERLDLDLGEIPFEAGVVLQARVAGHDSRFHMTRLDHHGQSIAIPAVGLDVGQLVRLRIRSRDVALATAKPASISVRNVFSGSVLEVAEDPGSAFAEVLVDIGGGRLRARITRDATADLGLAPGKPVYALVKSISLDRPAIGAASSALQRGR